MERKIFWKFNIIDLILIGIIAVSLFALLYKVTWGKEKDRTETYQFTYTCQSAPSETFTGITPGLVCSDGDYGSSLGKLADVNASGIEGDDRNWQATFTAKVEGRKGEHGVTVGDVLYLKGKSFSLVVGDSMFAVYLSDIQPLE